MVNTKADYVNFELIYTGTDNTSLFMTYREYTPDNLARPAFFQNLVYPANSDTIRFRDIKIKVHDKANSQIVYTVTEDGFSGK